MSYQRRLSDVTIGLIIISFDLVTRMTLRLDFFYLSKIDQKTKKYEYEIIVTVVPFVLELCILTLVTVVSDPRDPLFDFLTLFLTFVTLVTFFLILLTLVSDPRDFSF